MQTEREENKIMARNKNKSKRKRLDKDEVRRKSAPVAGGGGDWFNLPKGIESWVPEKKGKYNIDILPYETTDENHPSDVAPGTVWYQRAFKVHHGVGADSKSIICPGSIGMKCPICEEQARLSKDYDENEDVIKTLRPQRYVAFNILDPEDSDNVCLFAMSVGKFYNLLEQELAEAEDDDIANFFDVTDDGRTLKVRFSDASYSGRKYLEATKIEFKSRDAMDEDEIFGKVANLDEIFVVMDYDKVKDLFEQVDDDDTGDTKKDGKKDSKKNSKKNSKPPKEVDLDEMDEDELLAHIEENDIDTGKTPKQLKKMDADDLREVIEDAEVPSGEEEFPDDPGSGAGDEVDLDDMDEDELLAYIKENDIDLDITPKKLKKMDADDLREAIEEATKDADSGSGSGDEVDLDEMDEDELLAYIKENDIDLDLTMKQIKKLDADELREAIEDAKPEEEKIPAKRVLKRR
jgi:hypothetical protein